MHLPPWLKQNLIALMNPVVKETDIVMTDIGIEVVIVMKDIVVIEETEMIDTGEITTVVVADINEMDITEILEILEILGIRAKNLRTYPGEAEANEKVPKVTNHVPNLILLREQNHEKRY